MSMRFCTVEGQYFPESQFTRHAVTGIWLHQPSGLAAHVADRLVQSPGPLPAPAPVLPLPDGNREK